MRQKNQREKLYGTVHRRRIGRWTEAAALGVALALCFGVVWFFWLRPEPSAAVPAASASLAQVTNEAQPTPTVKPLPAPTATPVLTAAPAFTSAPASPLEAACGPGDTGDIVKMLQTMLLELGFDPGTADGIYGVQAQAAVRNFQLYAGLKETGVADAETAQALKSRWQAAQQVKAAEAQPLKGRVIGLDPGHQRVPNSEKEPIAPGSNALKDKVSRGAEGQFTGVPEYAVNLQVALKLKSALEALGARVVMTRETHDVNIPNSQRALMMNEAGVDCWLRIHANNSPNHEDHGMFILVPPEGGLDTDDPSVVARSVALAEALLYSTLQAADAKSSKGLDVRGDQTGFGWSQVPACNIEMGYMSNEAEERLLVTEAYQQKIVDGLAEGFVQYFSQG